MTDKFQIKSIGETKIISRIRGSLQKAFGSDFLRSVSVLISGNILAQLISVITIPIVSRIYSVQAFGEFAIFTSTGSIVSGIAALGMGSAIMAPKEDAKAKDVFYTAFVSILTISTLFLAFSILIKPFFHLHQFSIPYLSVCLLIYLNIVLSGLSSILSIYVNRLKKTKVLFWNSLISVLATLCITIPLGLLKFNVMGFILASLCAASVAITQMLLRVNPFHRILGFRQIKEIFREYKDYVRFQLPANFISNFGIQLPNQLFSANFGNIALGGYSMCERVMGYPIRLIAAPISTIYFRHATQYVHEGRIGELGAFSLKLINKILLITFLPVALFMIFSTKIFILVLGSKWGPAGEIASILTLQYILVFCNQCISICLVVLNKQRVNLVFSVIQLGLIALSISIGLIFLKSLMGTILIFGIGNVIVQILSLSFNFYYLQIRMKRILRSIFLFVFGTIGLAYALHSLLILFN